MSLVSFQLTAPMKILFSFLLFFAGLALADSWGPMKAELIEDKFTFGDTTIVRGVDGRKNQDFPRYYIQVLRDQKLLASYSNLTFGDLAASSENRVFVGVSNRGRPDIALIVFDDKGKLRHKLKHLSGNFNYCAQSVTLVREWYNHEDPDIEFTYSDNGEVKNISFNACNNTRISLDQILGVENKEND